jgi:predicted secreted Zn-dependent protease
MSDVREYIDQAVQNIESDRATTSALLVDAMVYLKKNEENHKSVGPIVAKYLETLQRSNEQLVKIASLVQKKQKIDNSITEYDKNDIFEQIESQGDQ